VDFAAFLYLSGRISGKQYTSLRADQFHLHSAQSRGDSLFTTNEFELMESAVSRQQPLGEIIRRKPWFAESCSRPPARDFDGLLTDWWTWHLDRLEPISDYSLTGSFGRRLFENQLEKQLVAKFLVSEPVCQGRCPILDDDVVVLPEGTSAFYIGLAVAAHRSRATIVTSNGGLVREYHENPVLRTKLKGLEVIRGHAESETRGIAANAKDWRSIVGDDHDPTATVVISTVEGLLPEEGPFAPSPTAANARAKLVEAALSENVRHVIFVADYSKQLNSKRPKYGHLLFQNRARWKQILNSEPGRVLIVTSPPPRLCEFIRGNGMSASVLLRNLKYHPDVTLSQGEVAEYEACAQRLVEIGKQRQNETLYHEAVSR
jgi:hypothetical protein